MDLHRNEALFRTLIESAPDAVIGVDSDGIIVLVNRRTEEYFGYGRAELVGAHLEILIPERFHAAHRVHRKAYVAAPRARPMGTGLALSARRRDGTEFSIDVSLSHVETDEGILVIAIVRDASERARAERDARRLREHQLLRRQALEINDAVVQGLASASYALDANNKEMAAEALRATLASARTLMRDLLGTDEAQGVRPGDLVRERAASVSRRLAEVAAVPSHPSEAGGAARILIADDTDDVRVLLRASLSPEFDIVGEARDGSEAIELVGRESPDAILLDLAMPVMDGLEAIPHIRAACPDTKIVVLSGYGRAEMGGKAMEAGADAYLEKGRPAWTIAEKLRQVCSGAPAPRRNGHTVAVEPLQDDEQEADVPAHVLLHELGTPLTVLRNVAETLRTKRDVLPPKDLDDLLDALARNVDHIGALSLAFSEARHLAAGDLRLALETIDLGALVEEVVRDARSLAGDRDIDLRGIRATRILADPLRVRQVLINLLSNAAKFSPRRSTIVVEMRQSDEHVEIAVTNTGEPIPAEHRHKLFKRFVRLSQNAPGLGIGLYVSRGLARAHGGDVTLERSDARGTTFTLTLPHV